jgi:hypothetical protein
MPIRQGETQNHQGAITPDIASKKTPSHRQVSPSDEYSGINVGVRLLIFEKKIKGKKFKNAP